MRILLLSAYDAMSHRAWREGLVSAFPEHQWTSLALPARYFSWRIRGNSLSWAFGAREQLERGYDLVIATSMVDLTALRGFVPALAATPTLVYFHENQFAYPSSGREFDSVEPLILNLYNALCADRVLFNSAYNRDTLLAGAERLLRKLPDQVPPGLVERIRSRAEVVPVPLPESVFPSSQTDGEVACVSWTPRRSGRPSGPATGSASASLRLLWAARWEFDKGPERLLAILRELERRGSDYRLCLLGERFRNTPAEFDVIERDFSHRLDQFGYAESREAYFAWLRGADIVLSTATHEFQGLSVLEAVANGCLPAIPDRLAYPELFGRDCTYKDYGTDIEREAQAAADLIEQYGYRLRAERIQRPAIERFSWSVLKPRYAAAMQRAVCCHR